MTNKEFAEKCMSIANNVKTLYVMGGFGAPLNERGKARYTQNHSYNKKPTRTKMINEADADTFAFDCVGLIKGVHWGFDADARRTYGGATYESNNVPDLGADTFFKKCAEISNDFSNIEIGELVHIKGHIGVYVGNSLVVECTPAFANKVQITTLNKDNPAYPYRAWDEHGKDTWIEYVKEVEVQTYYPKVRYNGVSIVDALNAAHINSTYLHRAKIALANGIRGYRGTAFQNTRLLNLLRNGKLIKPKGER